MKVTVDGRTFEGEPRDVAALIEAMGSVGPPQEAAPAPGVLSRSERMRKAWAKRKRKLVREAKQKAEQKALKKAGVQVSPGPISAERNPQPNKLQPKKSHHKQKKAGPQPQAIPNSHLESRGEGSED